MARSRQPQAPAPRPRRQWQVVALPSEHGGWSLTLEPVLLGLLVAWSWAGLALGGAALLAFLARTPLKLAVIDRRRGRRSERTRAAERVAALEVAMLIVLVVVAAAAASRQFWPPLLLAAPLVLVELWYDARSRSRRLVPELAGAIGIGSVAAAVALAGGEGNVVSFGLWCVIGARSLAAIPYVRVQISRMHGRPSPGWHSVLAQVIAVVAVVVGWALEAVPAAVVVAIVLLGVAHSVLLSRPPRPAKMIGVEQTVFGLAIVVVAAAAVTA